MLYLENIEEASVARGREEVEEGEEETGQMTQGLESLGNNMGF